MHPKTDHTGFAPALSSRYINTLNPMKRGYSVDFSRSPGYLLAKISGQWTTRNAEDAVDRIRQEAELRQERKILMDLMDFSAPDSEMTRYYTGEKIAEAFPFPFKVAGYSQSEKINRFTETVAVNRSAHFRVFDSREAAIDWLTRSGK